MTMDDYSAYRSAELAELYDAVYADSDDVAFWLDVAAPAGAGPILELGCGTGRVLLPLVRAGHEVTGIDLASHMVARCREKLSMEPPEVRLRATVQEADMTSFELDRRFAQILCAFGTFHHLLTAEEQLACLERCARHLLPHGTLVLDLFNPDPAPTTGAPSEPEAEQSAGGDAEAQASTPKLAAWTEGRMIRGWASVLSSDRALQRSDCEVTYEIIEADGGIRRLAETFPWRLIFRYELDHLLARCGFRIVALYGDYDRSPYTGESPGMIAIAERVLDENAEST